MFIVIIALPHLQRNFKIIEQKPLKGAFTRKKPKNTSLSFETWSNSIFQKNTERDLKIKNPLKSTAIRLINQFQYSFMKSPSSKGLFITENGTLMPTHYINSLVGKDLIPLDSVNNSMRMAKFVQDSLERRGIKLLFLIAPGKPSFNLDQVPKYFTSQLNANNNYKQFIESCKKYDIEYIDYKRILLENKDSFEYPIFTKFGVHWSGNTIAHVTKDLFEYINNSVNDIEIPKIEILPGEKTVRDYKFTDYDIGESMNLMFFESEETLHYPRVVIKEGEKKKPKLIAIGDSFFQSFVNFDNTFNEVFDKSSKFYFYNKIVDWPIKYQEVGIKTEYLDMKKEINSTDIIIIEMSEQNTKYLGYQFIHQLYNLFTAINTVNEGAHLIYDDISKNEKSLKVSSETINTLKINRTNIVKNIAFNRALKGEGNNLKQINKIIANMRSNPKWLDKLKKQAKEKEISLEKNMLLNAKYLIKQRQKSN